MGGNSSLDWSCTAGVCVCVCVKQFLLLSFLYRNPLKAAVTSSKEKRQVQDEFQSPPQKLPQNSGEGALIISKVIWQKGRTSFAGTVGLVQSALSTNAF